MGYGTLMHDRPMVGKLGTKAGDWGSLKPPWETPETTLASLWVLYSTRDIISLELYNSVK